VNTTTPAPLASPASRAQSIRSLLPPGGLFADFDWRTSPSPFPLDPATASQIEALGRPLLQFYRAANLLYRHSLQGRLPPWIAQWLEQGKPQHILTLQRQANLHNQLPRVIRPDLLLVPDGLRITELDSVPGGIGLTAWLNQTYSQTGSRVIGGPDGMLTGFASIFNNAPTIHIVVSDESATYRPEMNWLTRQLNARGQHVVVRDGSPFTPADGDAVYRFFELFDLDNVPAAPALFEAALSRRILLTPPPRSFLEEKLLFALLWNRRLREFWRLELGTTFYERLLNLVPYTWILDPSPLPPHAAIPHLHIADWSELKSLSQKDRHLILKISGFSSEAWGARGVYLGSDLSAQDWSTAVSRALESFHQSPWILQRYEKPRRVPLEWLDPQSGEVRHEPGRTRLCPYFFVTGTGDSQGTTLGGVLATTCPADKKIIHGMRDAALAPCTVAETP
jgi:hypothetical protein